MQRDSRDKPNTPGIVNEQQASPGQQHTGQNAGHGGGGGKLKLAQAYEFCQRIQDRVPYETAGAAAQQQKAFAWCQPVTAGNLNGDWTIYVLETLPGTGIPTDVYRYATKLTTLQEAERFVSTGHGGITPTVAGQRADRQGQAATPTS